jgi:hypothetical protein
MSNKISSTLKSNKANVVSIAIMVMLSLATVSGVITPQEAQQGVAQAADVLQTQVDLLAQNQTLLSASVLALTQNSTVYGEFIDLLVENQTALQNWLEYNVNPSFYTTSNPYNYIVSALLGSSQTYYVVQNCSVGTPVYPVSGQWYTLSAQQAADIAMENLTGTVTGGGSMLFNSFKG